MKLDRGTFGRNTPRSSTGSRLRQARLGAGLTQQQAGETVGVDPNTIARYEAGRIRPSSTALFALSHVYGRTVAWLSGEEDTVESVGDSDPTQSTNAAMEALIAVGELISAEGISLIEDYIYFVYEREERRNREPSR